MFEKEKEIWVRFACAALGALDELYNPTDNRDGLKAECNAAAAYADEMLRLFHEKYSGC